MANTLPFKPYDQSGAGVGAPGAQATLVFTGVAGRYWMIDYLYFSLRNTVGALSEADVSVTVAGGGTIFFGAVCNNSAVANVLGTLVVGPGLGIYGSPAGANVTVGFTGGSPNVIQYVSAGGYLI